MYNEWYFCGSREIQNYFIPKQKIHKCYDERRKQGKSQGSNASGKSILYKMF